MKGDGEGAEYLSRLDARDHDIWDFCRISSHGSSCTSRFRTQDRLHDFHYTDEQNELLRWKIYWLIFDTPFHLLRNTIGKHARTSNSMAMARQCRSVDGIQLYELLEPILSICTAQPLRI